MKYCNQNLFNAKVLHFQQKKELYVQVYSLNLPEFQLFSAHLKLFFRFPYQPKSELEESLSHIIINANCEFVSFT